MKDSQSVSEYNQPASLNLVSASSIAVDESCDINDVAQVSLFVPFISSKELLALLSFKGQTREVLQML